MQAREESDLYYTKEKLTRMLERFREMRNGERQSGLSTFSSFGVAWSVSLGVV